MVYLKPLILHCLAWRSPQEPVAEKATPLQVAAASACCRTLTAKSVGFSSFACFIHLMAPAGQKSSGLMKTLAKPEAA